MIILKLIASIALVAYIIAIAEILGLKEAGLVVGGLIIFICYLKTEGYE